VAAHGEGRRPGARSFSLTPALASLALLDLLAGPVANRTDELPQLLLAIDPRAFALIQLVETFSGSAESDSSSSDAAARSLPRTRSRTPPSAVPTCERAVLALAPSTKAEMPFSSRMIRACSAANAFSKLATCVKSESMRLSPQKIETQTDLAFYTLSGEIETGDAVMTNKERICEEATALPVPSRF
jgi:hypothetical protein